MREPHKRQGVLYPRQCPGDLDGIPGLIVGMAGCGERGFVRPATYPYSECGDRAILPSVPDMAPFVTIGTRAMASPDMRRPFRILECFPPPGL
uniref:Uncharacterized protein n=1 Tax=Leptospirillum ferrodiazotrophum TaxID=412449 RepID=C6HV79_9BACT|nr:MAG: hypothetical protein UBAL3_78920043 [Leptospirillum ferrodiazotrophum]